MKERPPVGISLFAVILVLSQLQVLQLTVRQVTLHLQVTTPCNGGTRQHRQEKSNGCEDSLF
jgi:hypothetical protein